MHVADCNLWKGCMTDNISIYTKIRQGWEFLTTGIWRVESRDLPFLRRSLVHGFRIIHLMVTELLQERIHLRAASLTFYSLLSIVPVLAMLFGLAKGFGLEKLLERELLTRAEGQEEILTRMIGFAQNLLENTKGGIIAGAGVILLLWSVIKIFGSIEKSFNEIWGGARERPFIRKVTDYLSLSVLCPLLISISSTLTVMITSEAASFMSRLGPLEALSPLVFLGLELLPLMALWALFTLIYLAIPNTRVWVTSALLAGISAGTAFLMFQRLYIQFQIGVAKYNAIYGSFAALPLFLVWLQLSWLILLVGAYLSFAYQRLDRFHFPGDIQLLSPRARTLLALLVSAQVVKRFCSAEGITNEKEISEELKIPLSVLQNLLDTLVTCGVLSRVRGNANDDEFFHPAIDPDRMTLHFVMSRLDGCGLDDPPAARSESFFQLSTSLEQLREAIEASPANVLLKHL